VKKDTWTFTNNRNNESFDLDILDATRGPAVVDATSFYKKSGMFLHDPGFGSTSGCSSDITYVDGNKGELKYRGYDIEELTSNYKYLDICYLLLHKKLPDKKEAFDFDMELRHRSFINTGITKLFASFRDNAHPMATLSASISALATFYFEHLDIESPDEMKLMESRVIAKMPTLAACAFRHSQGVPLIFPDIERSFTENFLYMMRAFPDGKMPLVDGKQKLIRDVEVRALDTIFSLHADHEQNASTTAVRAVGSTGAHPYAAISAGISALWGKAHGGANEAVIHQLEMIGDISNIDKYIAKAKDKQDPFRLMGFGHRVYKNYDPRAKILKKLKNELRDELGIDGRLIKIADKLEEVALHDEYFIKRNLYPNVDFYSGLILIALKIKTNMFTPIFVIGRTVGWITQLAEQLNDKSGRIVRPRQLYTGK